MVLGMANRIETPEVSGLSLVGVIRGFAEGSLVAVGFGLAILLIGTPLALLARGVHDGLSWLVGLGSETSGLMAAFVSVSSVLGSVILVVAFVRLLVAFFSWRRRLRGRVSRAETANTRPDCHDIAEAA